MIYSFEEMSDTLDLVPLSARRALDRAGRKVSLATWRAMALDVRRAVVQAGADDIVDGDRVQRALAESGVPFDAIAPLDDPAPDTVPETLRAILGPAVSDDTWRSLSPLDRYALAKVALKAAPCTGERPRRGEDALLRALSEIVIVAEPRVSHLTARGEAHMVDVGAKPETRRRAVARAIVRMKEETALRLRSGSVPKGDVLAAARIAGIAAAKRTFELIPLCHIVRLSRVTVDLKVEPSGNAGGPHGPPGVRIVATAEALDRTGVEMEALVAASTAALTIYDMLKGIDRGMTCEVALEEKTGGTSGTWTREA
jgi:cyclic pyranopterin phosphate synthase